MSEQRKKPFPYYAPMPYPYPQYPHMPDQSMPFHPYQPVAPMPPTLPYPPIEPEKLPLAFAYVPYQQYIAAYNPMEALKKGTLFPELYMPYKEDC